jgi:hypothetical protein
MSAYQKSYRKLNPEKTFQDAKTYREANKDKIAEQKRSYQIENKEQIAEYSNNYEKLRKETDVGFKLRKQLRSRLATAINQNQKSGSAVDDLDCSIEELKKHLESKFYPNPETGEVMTWDNWTTNGWHIDHIQPLSKFDLTDFLQFKEACRYTNLQPLWAKDNLRKSDNE